MATYPYCLYNTVQNNIEEEKRAEDFIGLCAQFRET